MKRRGFKKCQWERAMARFYVPISVSHMQYKYTFIFVVVEYPGQGIAA